VSDCSGLLVTVGLREEQSGLRIGRSHDDPPLGSTVVGGRRRILDQLEAERADEELDCTVVVVDDERDVLDHHSCTLGRVPRTTATAGRLPGVTRESRARSADGESFTDDELAAIALAGDPDAPIPDDAVPFGQHHAGASLLPEWYMPPPCSFRRTRARVIAVAAVVGTLLLVNGAGLCVTYGVPEIAW